MFCLFLVMYLCDPCVSLYELGKRPESFHIFTNSSIITDVPAHLLPPGAQGVIVEEVDGMQVENKVGEVGEKVG